MGSENENWVIRYRNRYSGKIAIEKVYGERWLRWAYRHPLAQVTLAQVAAQPCFSKWYGWCMRRSSSRRKILPFIEQYGLDRAEFLRPPESFESFDHFFYRQLKPESRPIDLNQDSVVFPADGRHFGFQDTSKIKRVFVKGQSFNLRTLLGDGVLGERFTGGSLVLSRLCPVDYHRFHFPAEGVPGTPQQGSKRIAGSLYSVNPVALRNRLSILWENRREVSLLKTERFKTIALIEVGATCVGSITQAHVPGQHVDKGAEKGYFRFGGSSVITLFEPGVLRLSDDLLESTQEGIELYAKMGDQMGLLRS